VSNFISADHDQATVGLGVVGFDIAECCLVCNDEPV